MISHREITGMMGIGFREFSQYSLFQASESLFHFPIYMYPECVVKNGSNTVCTTTQYKLNINHSN